VGDELDGFHGHSVGAVPGETQTSPATGNSGRI
jgi:hypothetical protein